MRRLTCLFVLFGLTACSGDDRPTAPSIPTAMLSPSALVMTSCAGDLCTSFNFTLTNQGPGCVDPDLGGTITLRKEAGQTSTASWEIPIGERSAGVFRPGTTRRATRSGGSLIDSPGPGTFSIAFLTQRYVPC